MFSCKLVKTKLCPRIEAGAMQYRDWSVDAWSWQDQEQSSVTLLQ